MRKLWNYRCIDCLCLSLLTFSELAEPTFAGNKKIRKPRKKVFRLNVLQSSKRAETFRSYTEVAVYFSSLHWLVLITLVASSLFDEFEKCAPCHLKKSIYGYISSKVKLKKIINIMLRLKNTITE